MYILLQFWIQNFPHCAGGYRRDRRPCYCSEQEMHKQIWSPTHKKAAEKEKRLCSASTDFTCKISISRLDSSRQQRHGCFQDGHVDIVPNIRYGGKLSNFLSYFHVFWKNRTKHCVCIFPLFVVCEAYEELWAGTNPCNRTPSKGWTNFYWNFLKCSSLGF